MPLELILIGVLCVNERDSSEYTFLHLGSFLLRLARFYCLYCPHPAKYWKISNATMDSI